MKNMKRLKIILIPVIMLAVSAACRKEDAYINVQHEIILTEDANDIKFDVSSNTQWKMTVSDPWFKVTPKRGSGSGRLRIVAERNNTGRERTSVMEFVSEESLRGFLLYSLLTRCLRKLKCLSMSLSKKEGHWPYLC